MKHQTYTDLVKGDDDLIGHIAYSIYKAEKLAWTKSFESANNGQEPTQDEVDRYFHHSVPGKMDRYRERALNLMNAYIDQEMETDLIKYRASLKHDELMKKVDKGLLKTTFENAITGLVQAGIAIFISTMVWIYSLTPDNVISNTKKSVVEAIQSSNPELLKRITSPKE